MPDNAKMASRPLSVLPWIGLGVIGLHNLEEALTALSWLHVHAPAVRSIAGAELPPMVPGYFFAALAGITAASVAWVLLTYKARPKSLAAYSLVVLFGMFFANAFVPHVAGAIAFRGYVPGVLTAVTVVIPFFILFVAKGLRADHFTRPGVIAAIAVAVLGYCLAGLSALHVLRFVQLHAQD
jgi:hypothetical protein